MRVSDIIRSKMTVSFEVFPPKLDQPLEPFLEVLEKLNQLKPDFISCTYGAGGTNKGRSVEICQTILNSGVECITHFTCISNTKSDVLSYMQEYIDIGITNIMALRGDFREGCKQTEGDFSHANELISFLKENYNGLTIGAACYPEKHIECSTMEEDIAHLRMKQNCGAEFLISQLCFDIEAYARWRERIQKAGVRIPVVMGIMPVLNANSIKRMPLQNGCSIPAKLSAIIGKFGDDPDDFKKAGKEYTIELIYKYMNEGMEGIHLYTMNKYEDISDIVKMTGLR